MGVGSPGTPMNQDSSKQVMMLSAREFQKVKKSRNSMACQSAGNNNNGG